MNQSVALTTPAIPLVAIHVWLDERGNVGVNKYPVIALETVLISENGRSYEKREFLVIDDEADFSLEPREATFLECGDECEAAAVIPAGDFALEIQTIEKLRSKVKAKDTRLQIQPEGS